MTQHTRKNQYDTTKPIDPTKRARAIREALKSGKIKPSKAIDETLVLLDEIVARYTKTA